jgi:hypothetical protein
MTADAGALAEVMAPLSGTDLVALWKDDEAMETLRASMARIAADDLVVEMIGEGDFKGTLNGIEGMREGWRDFLETFERFEMFVEEVIPHGNDLVVTTRQDALTATDGVRLTNDAGAIFSFGEDDKLRRASFYLNRADALKAAGIAG